MEENPESNPNPIETPLSSWGYNENPYIHRPLENDEELDALFCGRDREISTFLKTIQGNNIGICIEGDFGIGKSSFFNKCVGMLRETSTKLIIPDSIRLAESEHPKSVLLDIYAKSYAALEKSGTRPEGQEFQKLFDKISSFELSPMDLTKDFLMSKLISLGNWTNENLGKTVLLSLDNLEKNKIQNPGDFLEHTRELVYSNYNVVAIGDKGLREELNKIGRLRSVFRSSLELGPFSLDEFSFAVHKRLVYSAVNPDSIVKPLDDDVLEYTYDKGMKSDIRWALSFLNRIFQEMIVEEWSPKEYNLEDIRQFATRMALKTYSSLSVAEKDILRNLALLGERPPSDPFIWKKTDLSMPYIRKLLARMAQHPEIVRRRVEGGRVLYKIGYEIEIVKEAGFDS